MAIANELRVGLVDHFSPALVTNLAFSDKMFAVTGSPQFILM
ncbi:hypothetical protein ACS60D_06840 [Streptococcus suis]